MMMRFRAMNVFLAKVKFKQPWEDLVKKVERMLMEGRCWGVLVIRVEEDGKWSEPTLAANDNSFANELEWFGKALTMQTERPFSVV